MRMINRLEEDLAHAQAGKKPEQPALPTIAAVITIMVIMGPTLHDVIKIRSWDESCTAITMTLCGVKPY